MKPVAAREASSDKVYEFFYTNVNLDIINTLLNSLNLPPFLRDSKQQTLILTSVVGVRKPASGSQSQIVVFHVYS